MNPKAVRSGGSHDILAQRWYAAALSGEVTDKPFARQLLGENIVLFRTAEGIGAVEDRCPHRFAPLSLGKVQGRASNAATTDYASARMAVAF